MKKMMLFLFAVLLILPALTQNALIETELSYKPRNVHGAYSFGTYLGGTGQINLMNGNLMYGRQLVSRPGRAGLNLDLSIYYNSKIWDRDSGGMYVKERGSWVGLGWYLGFARLVQGTSTYAIIFPDGSSHEIQLYDGGVWKSIDSTYIQLDVHTKTAMLKGGAKLVFGNTVGNTSYMTEMKDRNGNQITATYISGTGKLDEVFDTLGKAAKFNYTDGYLDSVVSYGKVRATIYFKTSDIGPNPLVPAFTVPVRIPANERKLDSITVALADQNLVQEYDYQNLGEINAITNRIESELEATANTVAKYEYDTKQFSDPIYKKVQERVVTSKTEYSSATESYTWTLAYNFSGLSTNPNKTEVTDVRGVTAYEFNASTYPHRSWSDGLIARVQRKDLNKTAVYRSEATQWEQDKPTENYIVNPRMKQKVLILDDGKSLKTQYDYTHDGTGNVRKILQYKYDDDENVLRSLIVRYRHENSDAYADAHLTNLPAIVSIEDEAGKEVSHTEYGYDETPLMAYPGSIVNQDPAYGNQNIAIRGNATSVRNKLFEQGRFIISHTGYDVTGNSVKATDPKGNTSTKIYSSATNYVFPESMTNPLGHQVAVSWTQYSGEGAYYNGDVASVTDTNGAETNYWYDQLGRKILEVNPFDANVYGYDDVNYLSTQMNSTSTQYGITDPLGNPIQSISTDSSGSDIVQSVGYNNPWQQPSSVSFPYRDGTASTTATITYDALGRVLTQVVPGTGTTSYQYAGNTTTITDPEGHKKKYVYNEFGSIERLYEQDDQGNLTVLTKYEYNTLGKLIKITQVGQGIKPNQVRLFNYDSLGRLMSEIFPESGTNSYTYDDNGNVLSKRDARGIVVHSTYDALNRRTATTFSDGTPSASYVYDETGNELIGLIANSKGRMTSAWTSDGTGYSWTYDVGGRPTQQTALIDGQMYPLEFGYMDEGCGCRKKDLRKITYPDGSSVNYDKDSAGRVASVYQGANTVFARYTYNSPTGGLSDIQWGDGYNQHYDFDDKGALQQDRLTGEDGSFISWEYAYTNNQQISKIGERICRANPTSDDQTKFSYQYDQFGRLTSANHAIYNGVNYISDQVNSFTYDQFGNMLNNKMVYPLEPSLNRQSNYTVNPMNNRLDSYADNAARIALTYDAAGNMLSEGARSYAYDGAGRLVNAGPDAGIYRYDAFGRRIKKTYVFQGQTGTSYGSIVSVYGLGQDLFADYQTESNEPGNDKWITDYIVTSGQAIAKRTGQEGGAASLKYLHRNHMQQVIDPATYAVNPGKKSIQGTPYASGGDDQFQGHKEDAESGLHYNLARSYDPDPSRWTSADSLSGNAYDPQSLNKYSYVRNDPINIMDPDGRYAPAIPDSITVLVTGMM